MDELDSFIFAESPFSAQEIEVSSANYAAQARLFQALQSSYNHCDSQKVAAELRMPIAEVEAIVSGTADIPLSLLRQLANALGVKVRYIVDESEDIQGHRFREQLDSHDFIEQWTTTKDWDDQEVVLSP